MGGYRWNPVIWHTGPLSSPRSSDAFLRGVSNTVDRNRFKMPDWPESIDQLLKTVKELTAGEVWVHVEKYIRHWIGRNTDHTQFTGLDKVFRIWEANQVLYWAVGGASTSRIEYNSVLLKFSLRRTIQDAVWEQMKRISGAIVFDDEVPFHAVWVSVPDLYGFCTI